MYYTETVSLRLPQDLLTALDHRRGDVPRGTYIRSLIGTHLDTHPHPDPVVPPVDPPIPTPIQPPAPPDPPIETGAKRHLHRFKKAGVPVRHVQGVAYYRQVCDCGDTKVAP
jgi:hypothetical protein